MKRAFLAFLLMAALLLLLASAGLPLAAQDEACAPAPLLSLLSSAAKLLTTMEEGEQRQTLRALRRAVAEAEAACRDWRFTSDGEGMQPVLGPLTLPQGSYTLNVATAGYFNAALEVEVGLCAYRDASAGAFSRGQAVGGAARILDVSSESCTFLLAIGSANESWVLFIAEILERE
ncbi:MAG: hypothetical protein OXF22_09725 [Anaerolineaceae bacterium]|nr:hypothetical protein [Chloroflexota bacterium]MCY4010014.1 hypothetical protein [Anaerolineaceae bacterium]